MSLKTFDLVAVVDKVNVGSDSEKGSIRCMDLSEDNFYIGTQNCYIIHVAVETTKSNANKTSFNSKLQRHKQYNFEKPIEKIICCTSLGFLLFLCDRNVYSANIYGLELRSTKEVFRGVTCIAKNLKPPVFQFDEEQICVATRRKTLQVYTLKKDACILLKEINVPDVVFVLAMDNQTICTTLGKQYCLINYVTSVVQELFMYESGSVVPSITLIGEEEFLLNGPTDQMGVTVTKDGLSKRQPFTWSDGLKSVGFHFPYLLILGHTTITVHNILDQRQKQAISFTGGFIINDFEKHVFVATDKAVMAFIPVPYSKQIQMLLFDKRIDEAFDLLTIATNCEPQEYDDNYVMQVRAQAGFVYFSQANFVKATSLFIESCVDPREIICLYPLMMQQGNSFNPSRPLLHSIQDLTVVVKGSKSVFADAKKFLLKYLEQCPKSRFINAKVEIDTSLMKLYAECNHAKLNAFLSNENYCVQAEVLAWLTQFKRYHALALYYMYLTQPQNAIGIWHKLIHKNVVDENFPGIEYVITVLSQLDNRNLIYESLTWLLKISEERAIDVIIQRDDIEFLKPDQVCEFLKRHTVSLKLYLEYLIYSKYYAKELYHTHLASLYANDVIRLLNDAITDEKDVKTAREKFQTLLETSSNYRISSILQKIFKYPLHEEIAILYGKMGQHDKALKILVYKLKDFPAAERYCEVISKEKSIAFKRNVCFVLLNVYLNPLPEDDVRAEHFLLPAIHFLNNKANEFDPIQILEILPDDWSVDLLQSFLLKSLRHCLSNRRNNQVESNLCKMDYLTTKACLMQHERGHVEVTEQHSCSVCKKSYSEAACARYPNGLLVHIHCSSNLSKLP